MIKKHHKNSKFLKKQYFVKNPFFSQNFSKIIKKLIIKKELYEEYRIRVLSVPYFPVQRQNLRLCLYSGKYESEKTHILELLTQ